VPLCFALNLEFSQCQSGHIHTVWYTAFSKVREQCMFTSSLVQVQVSQQHRADMVHSSLHSTLLEAERMEARSLEISLGQGTRHACHLHGMTIAVLPHACAQIQVLQREHTRSIPVLHGELKAVALR
jgi:hypothetical protein